MRAGSPERDCPGLERRPPIHQLMAPPALAPPDRSCPPWWRRRRSPARPSAQAGHGTRLVGTRPGWADPSNRIRRRRARRQGGVLGVARLARPVPAGSRCWPPSRIRPAPSYQQWLSPKQFRRPVRAQPRRGAEGRRTGFSRSGFDLVTVPRNHLFVTAAGSVSQVEQTFQVNEALYRVDGQLVRAPDADPQIPSDLAGSVRAITGLDNAISLAGRASRRRRRRRRPASRWAHARTTGASAPDRAFPNPFDPGHSLPWLICGYTPAPDRVRLRLRRPACAGPGRPRPHDRGHRGVLLAHHPRRTSTASRRRSGCPSRSYSEVVAPGTLQYPKDPADTQDWYIEQALDVEWAHAVAPRARLVYVGAANDTKRARPGAERGGRPAHGRRRLQQLGHPREPGLEGRGEGAELGVRAGPGAGHGDGVRLRRRRRQPGRLRREVGRLPRLQPAGDVGGRHQPGRRIAGPAAVGDRLGQHRARLERLALDGRLPRRLPVRRRRRRQPYLREAVLPGRDRSRARCGPSRTCRWWRIRRPACCSRRPTPSPTAAPSRRSRGSAAPACRRR